ncbi:MAG: hypothetical protein KDA66_14685 [Planctomycetaceae bacterium]|nr:hypothetical protein [Planctomycetaceae bacterium]
MKDPMLISRRGALAAAAGVAGAAFVADGAAIAASIQSEAEIKGYEKLVGATFAARQGSSIGELSLAEVQRSHRNSEHPASLRTPFTLLFTSTNSLPQNGQFEVSHPELGTVSLFLHRVGREGSGSVEFEAVFA